nr:MAG TPA: Nck-associated protein 5, Peripheral clock protein [Caudoviricetes sp.]
MECLQYFRQSFSDWSDTAGIFFYPTVASQNSFSTWFGVRKTRR